MVFKKYFKKSFLFEPNDKTRSYKSSDFINKFLPDNNQEFFIFNCWSYNRFYSRVEVCFTRILSSSNDDGIWVPICNFLQKLNFKNNLYWVSLYSQLSNFKYEGCAYRKLWIVDSIKLQEKASDSFEKCKKESYS